MRPVGPRRPQGSEPWSTPPRREEPRPCGRACLRRPSNARGLPIPKKNPSFPTERTDYTGLRPVQAILPAEVEAWSGGPRLLARGRRFAFPGLPSGTHEPAFRLRGPLTVAGPRRILTGFRSTHPTLNCDPNLPRSRECASPQQKGPQLVRNEVLEALSLREPDRTSRSSCTDSSEAYRCGVRSPRRSSRSREASEG